MVQYLIYKTRNNVTPFMILNPDTIDSTSTSLFFVGKQTQAYGQPMEQSTLWTLENFANPTQPAIGILGQEWFNSFDNKMYVCTNESLQTWEKVNKPYVGATAPTANLEIGDTWYNSTNNTLYAYTGVVWTAIGPNSSVPTAIHEMVYLTATTTDATPNELFVNGIANSYLTIIPNSSWLFEVNLIGRVSETTSEVVSILFRGTLDRPNVGATNIPGGVETQIFNITNTLTTAGATVSADVTNNALNITVVGQAAKTIQWNAIVSLTAVPTVS